MIQIGICDDDTAMRKALRTPLEQKLQLLGEEYRIYEYESGEMLLARSEAERLDILFLDIEMRQLNGMDTAKALRKREAHTLLIFVTAYSDYVFQGYDVHAFHYILKPYEERKILSVLEQALKEIDALQEQFYTIEQKSGILKLSLRKILTFSSDRRKIVVTLTDEKKLEFYGKLDKVKEDLPDYFVRCHNRYLVNLNYVTSLEKDSCICGAIKVPVSRTFRQPLEVAFARLLLH